jgi:hypothetical protein
MNENANTVKPPVILFGDGVTPKASVKSPSDYYRELYGEVSNEGKTPEQSEDDVEVESQKTEAPPTPDESQAKQMRGAKP